MGRIDRRTLDLYLVTDRKLSGKRPLDKIVEEAVKGGVTMVQLREKNISKEDYVTLGRKLKATLKPHDVPLIINDDVEVAMACDADGVHLGQSDMSPDRARTILGPDKIIGLSVENFDQVQQAQTFDVDYIAASPVYSTQTKKDTKIEFLPEGVRKMVRMSSLPVIGIGGMNSETARDVIMAGAEGVAVVSAIIADKNPRAAAERISESVTSARLERELESGSRVRWSTLAHILARDILWKIRKEDFYQGMRSGNLKYRRFNSFMIQYEWIFRQYVQLMRYLEVRAESGDEKVLSFVRSFLRDTVSDTSTMHSFYLGDTPDLKPDSISDISKDIIEYLGKEVRTGALPVALAAMLAFPYLSSELGRYFLKHSNNESNRYISWVNLYGGQEFIHDVTKFTEITDSLAGTSGTYQKMQMLKAFRRSANLFMTLWRSQK